MWKEPFAVSLNPGQPCLVDIPFAAVKSGQSAINELDDTSLARARGFIRWNDGCGNRLDLARRGTVEGFQPRGLDGNRLVRVLRCSRE